MTLNATDFIINNDKYFVEDDFTNPIINCENIIYYEEEDSTVDVYFEISDQSDFDYYCYVSGTLEQWGSHGATGQNSWSFKYTITINSNTDYNVSLSVEDKWGNDNTNFTIVKYIGLTETASFGLEIPFVVLLFCYVIASAFKTKKRKG